MKQLKLILDNKEHILTDVPFELNFTYNKYSPELFYFEIGDEIENLLVAEIIIGFLPEEINKIFKQVDFIDSFGTLDIEEEKGIIIKNP